MVKGLVTISSILGADGKPVSLQKAIDYGWISAPVGRQPAGWGLDRDELVIGENLFVDQGRQALAYAFSGRAPISSYILAKFGVGTGTTAAKATDVALESPVAFSAGVYTKAIESVTYPAPFVLRVTFTIGAAECNGYALSEFGLFTGADVLVARKVKSVVLNKVSDYSPTMSWRVRL